MAAHTYDPAEYLMKRHRDPDDAFELRDEFPGSRDGSVPATVTYHVACHLQAQNAGLRSRDLLKAAGVTCTLVQRCSGIDGTWGYRSENYELARKVAGPLGREVEAAGNEVVCGDCHLANGSITQETGSSRCTPCSSWPGPTAWRRAGGREPLLGFGGRGARGLTLDDVLDLRAYERVREGYRARVIARKRIRRVGARPHHDPGLRVPRHRALPGPGDGQGREDHQRRGDPGRARHLQPPPARQGELSATLFIELTSDAELREWLPKLVGIERALGVAVGGEVVPSEPEAEHAAALTRDTVTPAVHYLRFPFSGAQVAGVRARGRGGPRVHSPRVPGPDRPVADVRRELLGDLEGQQSRLDMS